MTLNGLFLAVEMLRKAREISDENILNLIIGYELDKDIIEEKYKALRRELRKRIKNTEKVDVKHLFDMLTLYPELVMGSYNSLEKLFSKNFDVTPSLKDKYLNWLTTNPEQNIDDYLLTHKEDLSKHICERVALVYKAHNLIITFEDWYPRRAPKGMLNFKLHVRNAFKETLVYVIERWPQSIEILNNTRMLEMMGWPELFNHCGEEIFTLFASIVEGSEDLPGIEKCKDSVFRSLFGLYSYYASDKFIKTEAIKKCIERMLIQAAQYPSQESLLRLY